MIRHLLGLGLLISTVAMLGVTGSLTAQTPAAKTVRNSDINPTYRSIPQSAGQRTLIDFNDYEEILRKARAYTIQRFGMDIYGKGYQSERDQQGAENGQPIMSYSKDPDGQADTTKVRPLTEIDKQMYPVDPLRDEQLLSRRMRGEEFGKGKTEVVNEESRKDVKTTANNYSPLQGDDTVTNRTDKKAFQAQPGAGAPAATAGAQGSGQPSTIARDITGQVQYIPSVEDFHLDNWIVELNSSARTVINRANSYCKEVKSFAKKDGSLNTDKVADIYGSDVQITIPKYTNENLRYLGVRIHFPEHKYNANARVAPAFDIPAFDSRGLPVIYSRFDPQYSKAECADSEDKESIDEACTKLSYNGVMHNVAQIKSLVIKISGRGYPHGVAVRLRDQYGEVSEYFMGYLNFYGWKTLRWDNPNYVSKFSEEELLRIPLYPTAVPYRVLDSFVIYRNGDQIGGNFVTAIAWVKMDFDLAVAPNDLKDIDVDDDSWWYVIRDENTERNNRLLKYYAEQMDIRQQVEARVRRKTNAKEKMPVESNPGATGGTAGGNVSGGGSTGGNTTPPPTR